VGVGKEEVNGAGRGRRGSVSPDVSSNSPPHPYLSSFPAGLFEVNIVTPPPRSLGIYALPPLTHNGEEVDIDQGSFIVVGLNIRYRLEKGKYVRDHSR
jgi:hypothetical protein